ncbi:hypothetical protein LXL04_002028 [Taraxacum kok-saghyz]
MDMGVHEAAKTRTFFGKSRNSLHRLAARHSKTFKMPKELRSSSLDMCRASPYPHYYKTANKIPSPPTFTETEWEDARCPICIDHPHNAVLLLCSSRDKGCRPYMCDTSSRHSNCFDQFRKSTLTHTNPFQPPHQTKLLCPLCRGHVTGWMVVDPARNFMNKKPRTCSSETCNFTGTYPELRNHARRDHPYVRPTEVDPGKLFEWRMLREDIEHQEMLNMQLEFDENESIDQVLEGLSELASPMWDLDADFMNFLSNFDSEIDNMIPDFDASFLLDDWEEMFGVGVYDEEIDEWGIGDGANTQNRVWENVATTRRMSNRNGRPRVNWSHQVSDNHQVQNMQINSFFDFHDFGGANLP